MDITSIYYTFHNNKVIVKVPFKIIRETEKCYFIEGGYRYLKENIGKPLLKSVTQYPYIELIMVDADEETLRKEMSKWFTDTANFINKLEV